MSAVRAPRPAHPAGAHAPDAACRGRPDRPPRRAPPPAAPEPEAPPHREALVRGCSRAASGSTARSSPRSASLVGAKRARHRAWRSPSRCARSRRDARRSGSWPAGSSAARRGYLELAWEELRGAAARRLGASTRRPSTSAPGSPIAPERGAARGPRAGRRRPARGAARRAGTRCSPPVCGLRRRGARARACSPIFDRHVARGRAAVARTPSCHRDWLRPWVAADPDSPTAPAPPGGRRTFAIMDYGHPRRDRASANIGDHIQSIAALGHLVRHRGVRLHGREELVDLLERARRPHAAGAAARRRRRRPRGDDRPPRRLDVRADPRGHLGPLLRLVHARAVPACATASRCTATCGRSSSRSTATSASCSRRRRSSTSSATGRSAAATGRPSTCCSRSACRRSSPAA